MKRVTRPLLILLAAGFTSGSAAREWPSPAVDLEPQQIRLPPVSLALLARDARIPAEEYELAQQLGPMLDDGRYAEADTLLLELKTLSPALTFVRAQIAMQQDRYGDAEKLLQDALQRMPDYARAHQALGLVYIATDKEDQALQSMTRAISLGVNDVQMYSQLAFLYLKREQPWAAIDAYRHALLLRPDEPALQRGLLHAYVNTGNLGAAAALLDKLLEADPQSTALWLQRADLALRRGNTARAIAALEAAVRLGEQTPANQLLLAQLHLKEASYERAVDILIGEALQADIADSDIDEAVSWLIQNRQWQHASTLLDAVRSRLSRLSAAQRSRYHLNAGKLAAARGDDSAAVAAFTAAAESDPANGAALLAAAEINLRLQRYSRALSLYDRCTVFDDLRQTAMIGKAQVFIEQHNYEQALAVLEQAVQRYPDTAGLRENLYLLQHIVATQRHTGVAR